MRYNEHLKFTPTRTEGFCMMTPIRVALLALLLTALAACGGAPEPVGELPTVAVFPTETETATPTATIAVTDTPTVTPEPSATPLPTNTATATATATITPNAESTAYIQTEEAKLTQIAVNESLLLTLDASGVIPTATNTSVPIADLSPSLYYAQDPARIRACAKLDNDQCPVRVELSVGDPIMVTGETAGDVFRDSTRWYRVDLNGQPAFVHSLLLGDAPPTLTPLPADLTLTALAPTVNSAAPLIAVTAGPSPTATLAP